jgi:cobalt/nickel transport system permease protein
MTALPAWMSPSDADLPALPVPRGRPATRRALGALLQVMAVLVDDAPARRRGLLQAIDPRVKLPALLGLVVLATLVHGLPALLACYALGVLLALLSAVPPGRLWGAWLAPPLLSALIVLPAALNVVTPGPALLPLGHGWTITAPGAFLVGRFALRAAACMMPALLLVATTRPARLFGALRALGVPATFVLMLAMMERYLAVLARGAEEIHLAKLSRSILPGTLRQEQAWVAAGIGALYRRTQALGATVTLAMISRGYTGDPRLPDDSHLGWRDGVFVAGVVVIGVMILLLEQRLHMLSLT